MTPLDVTSNIDNLLEHHIDQLKIDMETLKINTPDMTTTHLEERLTSIKKEINIVKLYNQHSKNTTIPDIDTVIANMDT